MKKSIVAVLLVCVLIIAAVFSGCGQQNTQNMVDKGEKSTIDSGQRNNNQKIEMRISWWGSETRHKNTLEAIKLYEEKNPNVKIVPEYQGWDGYKNKLIAQVMAGNAPDIFSTIAEWYPELLAADGIADITGKVDVSGHNPKYVEACSVDGKMYGVNLSVNGKVLIQNKILLDEYGIAPLKVPYTWEDLANKFKEVYEKSGGKVYGAPDFSVNTDGMGFPIFQDYVNTKLSVDGPIPFDNEKYTFTKEQIQDFYQYFSDLRKTNGVAPPEMSSINDFSANSLLIKRLVAFEINFAGTFGRFQDQMKDDLDMLPFPVGPNGETADVARPGIIFSVFKQSKHIDEAAKFIDFFTNSPEAAKVLKTCRGVLPTEVQRKELLETEGVLTDTDKKVMSVVDEIMKRDLRAFYAGPIGSTELQSIFPKIGQKIAFNQITVEEGAEEFMKEVEKLSR